MKKSWIPLPVLVLLLLFAGSLIGMRAASAQGARDIYLPLVILSPSCRNQIPDQPAYDAAAEAEVLRQINRQRAANGGLPPVRMNASLVQIARFHSIDMAVNNVFDHNGSRGESPWDRYEWLCEKFGAKGEIIAGGYTTPAAVVAGWMASPGHRANILNPDFTVAGVGYAYLTGSQYRHYWTVNFGTEASAIRTEEFPPGDELSEPLAGPLK